jgi:4-hydroxy-tetrahydrodipicolinate reductase
VPNNPIRVLVWGPGGLGNICIREVLRMPEFELAGVLAYSPHKNGADVATLIGSAEPVGVAATTDFEEAVNIEADVVMHLARDFGRYDAIEGIEGFLRAGRNVISVHPFHHVAAMVLTTAPDDTAGRIEAACAAGGSTFHATGIHPEWVADRMAPTLTGICTDIRNVTIYENWDMGQFNAATLSVIGFGKSPEAMAANPAIAQMTDNYCLQNLHGLATGLGMQLERTSVHHDYASAPVNLEFASLSIAAGTVGRLTHTWHGFRAGEDTPILTAEVNWMLGRAEMVPPGMDPTHYYGVRIEGTPSVEMGISIKGSVAENTDLVDPADPTSEPGYYGAVATCLQAAPRVLAAGPGWLGPVRPSIHWAPDLRTLAAIPVSA